MRGHLFFFYSAILLSHVSSQQLPKTCPEGESCKLRVCHKKQSSMTAVYNFETYSGTAIDYEKNIAVLYNGQQGVQFQIDLNTKKVVYSTKKQNSQIWIASEKSFQQYIEIEENVQQLTTIINSTEVFNIASLPAQHDSLLTSIIVDIEPSITDMLNITKTSALSIFVELVSKLKSRVKNKLWNIIKKKLYFKHCLLYGGLTKLISIFGGISIMIEKTRGSIESHFLHEDFDFDSLLLTESGSEIVAVIGFQIAQRDDASVALSPFLKEPKEMYEVVFEFGGGLYKGLYAVEAFIGNLLLCMHNSLSPQKFIDILIQIAASIGTISVKKFHRVVDFLISVLEFQVRKYPISLSLCGIRIAFLKHLRSGTLVLKGLNIWSVTKLIFDVKLFTLDVLMKLIVSLGKSINISYAIALLLYRLLYFTISGEGFIFVAKLIPSINITIDFHGNILIITQIMRLVDHKKMIGDLLSFNIEAILTSVPIFGDIYKAVIESMTLLGISTFQVLTAFLKNGFTKTIVFWFRFGLGLEARAPAFEDIYGLGLIRCGCWQA